MKMTTEEAFVKVLADAMASSTRSASSALP